MSDVMEEVQVGHISSEGIYRDFCDGRYVQCHPILKQDHQMLQLSFYFDELEVANPLGSKRGKHKLGNKASVRVPHHSLRNYNVHVWVVVF